MTGRKAPAAKKEESVADYTLAVGTHDPHGFAAESVDDALVQATRYVGSRFADDLRRNEQEVVTLLGPGGLITRPAERLEEFMRRVPGAGLVEEASQFGPRDANIPDCNGD
jgi:hypothetical protein